MNQLFDVNAPDFKTWFDGATAEPVDYGRMNAQTQRVYDVMSDGQWRTIRELQDDIERRFEKVDPEVSLSARLRDLRKPRFGGYEVERRKCGIGLFEYRLRAKR